MASYFPKDGKISVLEGSGDGGNVVLPFRLDMGSVPLKPSGSFVSFALPPVVVNVVGPQGQTFSTSAIFNTEIGAPELRTLQLTAAANAPTTILRDPTVNRFDTTNRFLTSWVWAESDPIAGGPMAAGSAQSTPVAISAATNVATAQAETHSALFAGVLLGIAGGALVAAMQELFGGLRQFPRLGRRRRAHS
jgi:hypothetical protein